MGGRIVPSIPPQSIIQRIEFSRTFSYEKITGISISILATFENIKNSIIDDVEMCFCTEAFVKIEIF